MIFNAEYRNYRKIK